MFPKKFCFVPLPIYLKRKLFKNLNPQILLPRPRISESLSLIFSFEKFVIHSHPFHLSILIPLYSLTFQQMLSFFFIRSLFLFLSYYFVLILVHMRRKTSLATHLDLFEQVKLPNMFLYMRVDLA